MTTLLLISLLLLVIYAALLLFYWWSWRSIPVFKKAGTSADLRISVIIPARNEEANIAALLRSLQEQSYSRSLTEVIVVDDHSTDATAAIAAGFAGVRVISLKNDSINSYKKKAIETGIAASTGELIVTTDADCIAGKYWLETIASFKKATGAVLIAAPVSFAVDRSPLQVFQAMDFMMLQGITGAAVYRKHLSMSNGANLAYERRAFDEVGGFKNIDHIASGDDMLLMHKIAKRYPDGIAYLESTDAIVSTLPMLTWRSFLNQRIRWASKATQYNDARIFPVLLTVYLFNLSIPALFVSGCWDPHDLIHGLIVVVLKTMIELPLYRSLAFFFDKRWTIPLFPLFQPLHILYTLISGFLGQFGHYEWKGRRVR